MDHAREIVGLKGTYVIDRVVAISDHGRRAIGRRIGSADEEPIFLKELQLSGALGWIELERFLGRARLLGDLSHPSIPALVDLFATDGARAGPVSELSREDTLPRVVFVRRFVRGESINDAARRRRHFTNHALEHVFRSMLGTLKHLHEHVPPLVHGGIHAGNVVLDEDLVAHFTSLGLPALERGEGPVSPEGDIAAAARLVVSLASHQSESTWPREISTNRARLAALAPNLSPLLLGALARCLGGDAAMPFVASPDAGSRPPTASALLDELARAPAESLRSDCLDHARATSPRTRIVARRILALVVISALLHCAGIAIAVFAARFRPLPAPSTTPVASPKPGPTPAKPLLPEPAQATEALSVVVPPQREVLLWGGKVEASTGSGPLRLSAGDPCLLTASVDPQRKDPQCTISLACAQRELIREWELQCHLIETHLSSGMKSYALRIAESTDRGESALRINRSTVDVFDDGTHHTIALAAGGESVGRRGEPLTSQLRFAYSARYEGTVVEVAGMAGVVVGQACVFDISPPTSVDHQCHVALRCGTRRLYDREGECSTVPTKINDYEDVNRSVVDGDPTFRWDDHALHLDDVTPDGPSSLHVFLSQEKPRSDEGV